MTLRLAYTGRLLRLSPILCLSPSSATFSNFPPRSPLQRDLGANQHQEGRRHLDSPVAEPDPLLQRPVHHHAQQGAHQDPPALHEQTHAHHRLQGPALDAERLVQTGEVVTAAGGGPARCRGEGRVTCLRPAGRGFESRPGLVLAQVDGGMGCRLMGMG